MDTQRLKVVAEKCILEVNLRRLERWTVVSESAMRICQGGREY
jgi:hypothetical protein